MTKGNSIQPPAARTLCRDAAMRGLARVRVLHVTTQGKSRMR